MKPTNPGLETLLSEAIEIADASERDAYLREACGEDGSKLADLRSMVRDYFAAGSVVDRPAAVAPTLAEVSTTNISRQIGPYKLRELLGEGGMGSVYVAEQDKPVRRKVALKIIKPGMGSREVISRFESERQALALMDHPNIARVLDAGTTDIGLPYFVMELVKGVPITEHCDTQKLTTRDRLQLFLQVCHAVQHAHQKGIIHRDIKPSNVIVAIHDVVPVVKVIDFGVAKAIGQKLTDNTLYTAFSQMVGTPLYMSPEQAGQSSLDVDTRSDVYSLGVLLYELLTGNTPFDKDVLKQAGFDEMRRIIREVDPPRPSARLSTLNAEAQSTVAVRRQIEPRKLSHQIRGDLDWIVMKAMEKDRNRRYETATGLALDIKKYLAGDAIDARPPNVGYRLRKFANRNKIVLIPGAMVGLALVLALVGTTWQAGVATRARQLADERYTLQIVAEGLARAETQRANLEAEIARKESEKARTEAAISKAVNAFINKDLLGKADLNRESNRDLKVREVLARSAESIEGRFSDQPLIEAAIRNTIGDAYFSLGLNAEAEKHFRRVWELRRGLFSDDHPDIRAVLNNLSVLYMKQGRFAEAEPVLIKVLESKRREIGEEHQSTLLTACNLASAYREQGRFSEAEPLFLQTLEAQRRVLGDDHADTILCASGLADLYYRKSRFKEAEKLYSQAVDGGRKSDGGENPRTLDAMRGLAHVFVAQARYAEAKSLFAQVLEVRRRILGEEHPDTLKAITDLGYVYTWLGLNNEAESMLTEALDVQCRVLGEEHPNTLSVILILAQVYCKQAHYAKAEPLARKLLEIERRLRGSESPTNLGAINTLALVCKNLGRYTEAESLLREALDIQRRLEGDDNLGTTSYMSNLASVYRRLGRYSEALQLITESLTIERRLLGEEHPMTLVTEDNLAHLYMDQGHYAEAEPLLFKILEIRKKVSGEEHLNTLIIMTRLANLFKAQGRFAESEELFTKLLEITRTSAKNELQIRLPALNGLGQVYLIQGRRHELESVTADILTLCASNKSHVSPQMLVWVTFAARSYCSMDKSADAEVFIRDYLKAYDANQPVGWERQRLLSLLGICLVAKASTSPPEDSIQRDASLAEAERLLVESYDDLYEQREIIPHSYRKETLTECLQNLVKLYELRGDKVKSAEWAAKITLVDKTPPSQ